jgi:hypothetical protein
MNRRGFLGAMLAAASAPAIVKAENLMKIMVPKEKKILTLSALAGDFDGDVIVDSSLTRKMFYWEEVNRIVKEVANKRMLSPTLFDHNTDKQKLIIPDIKPMFELRYGEVPVHELAQRVAKRQPLKFAYRL